MTTKITAEMKKHGWQPVGDGRVWVGEKIMTLAEAREIIQQHKAAQRYADTHDDGSDEPWETPQ